MKPGEWLNSNVINFFANFLDELHVYKKSKNNNVLMNTMAYAFLGSQQFNSNLCFPERIINFDKLKPEPSFNTIFENKAKIFWMINYNFNHWYLIETKKINFSTIMMTVYDSYKLKTHPAERPAVI